MSEFSRHTDLEGNVTYKIGGRKVNKSLWEYERAEKMTKEELIEENLKMATRVESAYHQGYLEGFVKGSEAGLKIASEVTVIKKEWNI